jgi:hypothetical protein
VANLPTGPKEARSTVLSVEEEAVIVAFRCYALQPTIPQLMRSSLTAASGATASLGCTTSRATSQRRGVSRSTRSITSTSAYVSTEQGKLHMVGAIDCTSKFAFVELHEKATIAVSPR